MQEYTALIEHEKYLMLLYNLIGVNGIDRLYVTPSESVEKVELIVQGECISVAHPRISNTHLDGKVTFWKNWYLSKNNALGIRIKITMKDNIVPIIHYRAKATGGKICWEKKVFIPNQDWIPQALVDTPYNNILIYRGGMLALKYVH